MSFLLFSIGVQYLGIDLGSEYLKMAESTILGEPKMKFNPNGKNFRGAVAARKIKFVNEYNSTEYLSSAEVRFGNAALKTLKAHPEFGHEYLARAFGRSNSTFHSSSVFSPYESMKLLLQDVSNTFTYEPDVIFAVPFYWTSIMRQEIASAANNAGMKVLHIVDDKDAVASHYGAINYQKYNANPRNVLFVDIGSTSVKAYGYVFSNRGNYSFANETGTSWSETTGSYYFAKGISAARKISMKKATAFFAEKQPSQYFDNISEPVHEMINVVSQAAEQMKNYLQQHKGSGNSGEIDEIQVFGGSSRISFFNKLITKATGCKNVLHEFNPNEAIAKGIIYLRQMIDGSLTCPTLHVDQHPSSSIFVESGGKTDLYCRSGSSCSSPVRLYNVPNTTEFLYVAVTSDDLPEGAANVQYIIRYSNYSNATDISDKSFIEVHLKVPSTEVQGLRYCTNNTHCVPIYGTVIPVSPSQQPLHSNFTDAFIESKKFVKVQRSEVLKVETMVNQIYSDVQKKLSEKGLNEESVPVEVFSTLKKYMKMVEEGSLNNLSLEQLKDAQTDLKINSKHLLEAVEKLKGKKSKKSDKSKQQTDDIFNDLKNDLDDEKDL